MNALSLSFRQTLGSLRLVWLLYGLTLVLGLLAALPLYNTINAQSQNSLAFLKLLNDFDYTVFSDFMHRSGRAISPLMSVGRWLGVLYVFLSVFVAGGILFRFAQMSGSRAAVPFHVGTFLAACSQYVRRFLKLFGVTLLFVLVGAGIWLVLGTLVSMSLTDTLTERGVFWVGMGFFGLFALTATVLLCIGDYAKVLMFREDERNAFRAFGRAGRLIRQNPVKTLGPYWLLIGIGTGLFAIYFLVNDLITMRNWPTIIIMLVVQQALVFARAGLKAWSLGTAYAVYETLPKPRLAPATHPMPVAEDAIPVLGDATIHGEELGATNSDTPSLL